MPVYQIHITGMVQGVGFRPYVHKLAVTENIAGWVTNGTDGLTIICKGSESCIQNFYQQIILQPPPNAIISNHSITITISTLAVAENFYIKESTSTQEVNLLITPDLCICDDCKKTINTVSNTRYQYPFTTCLNCGPRYSIQTNTPYDRINTTMALLKQCPSCLQEYDNVLDSRHHSQTNSCPNCAIKMHLYNQGGEEIICVEYEYLPYCVSLLKQGKILAIKGVGGYLLLCDATNESSIQILRDRKRRKSKPFALLYADLEMLQADTIISPTEIKALKDKSAPIVLCKLKANTENKICLPQIAKGLDTIGAMLPSTPMLQIIAQLFNKPLIATSANLSGSPIIYQDIQALYWLNNIADYLLSFNRDIVAPQDDSVVQFSARNQKIVLRRSRGLAPNYYPKPFTNFQDATLAMGAELKAAFALTHHQLIFISQYLGDQASVESEESYLACLEQVSTLLDFKPTHILVDKHPKYQVSQHGKSLALKQNCSITEIQHHEAHFAAVLAENNLLTNPLPVLGFIWDGAGFGDDQNIWGGEFFEYKNQAIKRIAHLRYFPQLLANKMSKEPRLSALSLLNTIPNAYLLIKQQFSDKEWQYYLQVLQQPNAIYSSSMGRIIDAVACILGVCSISSYEGEAAMQLEALARKSNEKNNSYYPIPFNDGIFDWQPLFVEITADITKNLPANFIAKKFFFSLAKLIANTSNYYQINQLAFSGGVFQNALLVDFIIELLQHKKQLFFHQQLSPNDECIGFGQLAWYNIQSNYQVHQVAFEKNLLHPIN